MVDVQAKEEHKEAVKRKPRKRVPKQGAKVVKTPRQNISIPPSAEAPKPVEQAVVASPVPKVVEPPVEVRKEPIIKFRRVKKAKVPKEPKPERPKRFFSEEHPGLFKIAKTFLPRLHVFILLYFLLYAMYSEYMRGNTDFIVDWFKMSPFATMPLLMSDAGTWWNEYGIVYTLWGMVIFCIVVTVYFSIWRYFFKDYYKNSEGSKRREGRVYWRNNNMLYQIWDKHYGSPPRTMNIYYLHINWWFNFINPAASLVRLDTTLEEKFEVSTYKLVVDEKVIRRKVDNDMRHFTTLSDSYETDQIPTIYAQGHFDLIAKTLIEDTTNLSFGNADTRNMVMQDGLRLSKPTIRRYIVDNRAKVAKDTDRPN